MTGESPRALPPVFISYATSDRKQAIAICRAIEQRGLHCWISCRDVEPGGNYQEAIVRAIREAPAMVLIFSRAANRSDEIKKELSLGSRYHIPVLALRIEDVEPSDAFAYELSTRQWIDAFRGWDKSIDVLTAGLNQFTLRVRNDQQTGQLPPPRRLTFPRFSRGNWASAATLFIAIAAATATLFLHGVGSNRQVSLAVLPFADLSPARDKAYFAEGMAEEILSSLAVEKNIKVLGRTSARQLERSSSAKEVRALLGVTHLLEGSTRTAGNNLRVNVRLIDTSDGNRLWEEEYNGALSDVFSVQDRIAEAVVSRLRTTLFHADVVRDGPVTKVDAYQAYLAARSLMRDRTKPSLTKALHIARQVIQSDPKFAPGHGLYAELLWHLSDAPLSYGDIPAEKARQIARPHALKAIQLAPNHADGYAALGLITWGEKALAPLQRAIELDPARAELRIWLGISLSQVGRYDEAYEQTQLAAEVEPLWAVSINRLVNIEAASRRFNEALAEVEKFARRGGDEAHALRFRSAIARRRGDHARASAYAEAALARNAALPYIPMSLASDYRLLGLTKLAAAAVPKNNETLRRLLISGPREAVYGQARTLGASLWKRPDADVGIFALSAARDWSGLAALYRAKGLSAQAFCQKYRRSAIPFVLALQRTGGGDDARALAECLRARSTQTFSQSYRDGALAAEDDFDRARLLSLAGDRSGAITWLERAVRFGWLGYDMAGLSSDLANWPEFDSLRADGRLPTLQQQINAAISAQRARVLSRHAKKPRVDPPAMT